MNVAIELRTERYFGVFIDETGSPGLEVPGLNSDRKSWVAVIIPPNQIVEVLEQLPRALEFLEELGVTRPEFHFKDILGGRGGFEVMNVDQRLAIFRFMVNIFTSYKFTILVQTLNSLDHERIKNVAEFPPKLGPLRLDNYHDLALVFLICRIREHLREAGGADASACVVVDEGRLKKGASICLGGLAPLFHSGAVYFESSRTALPLQLADFAAFCLNRTQMLISKSPLSEFDKELLRILSPMAQLFVNTEKVVVSDFAELASAGERLRTK